MQASLFLLKRYLWPRQGNFLAFALWISVVGVALGIIQLIVVLSVMSGFQKFLSDSYTHITSEIIVIPKRSQNYDPAFRPRLLAVEGVQAATPFAIGQAMIIHNGVGGVTLEGVDLKTTESVTPWPTLWVTKPKTDLQNQNPYWIWLGVQLAKKLKVQPGDSVDVFFADQGKKKIVPFVVTAITKFGIYDHDLHFARIDYRVLADILKNYQTEPMYKVKMKPGAELEETAERVRKMAGNNVVVRQWNEVNQNLFQAVQHQKGMLFLIMEIVVALAAINVVNLLMMSSNQRRRDIAILRAMGMKFGGVFFFFVVQGAAVGVAGILLGVGLGVVACHLVERFQPSILSESIYNVTRLPVQIDIHDVGLVAIVAFGLCIAFSVLPALRATLMRPVKALRYE